MEELVQRAIYLGWSVQLFCYNQLNSWDCVLHDLDYDFIDQTAHGSSAEDALAKALAKVELVLHDAEIGRQIASSEH